MAVELRALFTVRHGGFVVHCKDADALSAALVRLKQLDLQDVETVTDPIIRTKLMEADARLLAAVNADLGQQCSGLGVADKLIRKAVGNRMAKKIADVHTAWNVVRHIGELDAEGMIASFRSAVRERKVPEPASPASSESVDFGVLPAPAMIPSLPAFPGRWEPLQFPVKNTFLHFQQASSNAGSEGAASAPATLTTLPDAKGSPRETMMFDIFEPRADMGTQTYSTVSLDPWHSGLDPWATRATPESPRLEEPASLDLPPAEKETAQSNEHRPTALYDPWQHGDDPWSKAACAGRKPGQHGNSLNPDAQLCLRSTSFGIGAATLEKTDGPLPLRTKLFINNEWVDCSGGRLLTPFALGQRRFSPRCRRRATRM